MHRSTHPTPRPVRRLRRALAGALAVATALAVLPSAPAHAVSPFAAYEQWVGGSGVAISGTYTPLVGNFGGGRGDDIFWYAPGPAPDYLWISSTTRGSFTKTRKDVGGTYLPIVGDFAGDTWDDILWYAPGTAPDTLWTAVDTTATFTSSPFKINGSYLPIALDSAIPWAGAATSAGTPVYSAASKDVIVWYRPGTASDLFWRFNADGTGAYTQGPIAIDGSPRLIALNPDSDIDEDLFAYQPGSGADALFTNTGGAFTKTARSVSGTYTPVVAGGGIEDGIIWHGPGSAPDAYWASGAWTGTLVPQRVDQIATQGPIARTTFNGSAFLFDPTGPDQVFSSGAVLDALDPEQSGTARILSGDFDNNLSMDAYFYRPGSGAEVIAFGTAAVFA